ncbi:MAG: glycine cleavage system protein R [Planctomycetes bacterium]|nr:glycine cleavage system protein R [Planctomycetota bacterium]
MRTCLLVTITCPDRPGVVERITQAVVRHSANWEDSRMARLGGDFAGIVKISVAEEHAEALIAALRALADPRTSVLVKTVGAGADTAPQEHGLWDLRLTGADHEGIVHEVAAYLAGRGINVESMETTIVPAPVSGSPLFHMEALIKVPANQSLDELRDDLTRIGEAQGVDVEVVPH